MGIFFLVMPLAQTRLPDGGQAWLIGNEYMCLVCEITLRTCDISEMSRQGRPITWPLTGSFQNGLLPLGPEPLGHELDAEWLEAEGRPKP